MTNEELVKRLRLAYEYEPLGYDGWEAADRIEQILATNEYLNSRLENVLTREAETYAEHKELLEAARADAKENDALKAKLAKAVEALRKISAEASVPVHTWKNGINFKKMYEGWRKVAVQRIDKARATLAEIEGEKT